MKLDVAYALKSLIGEAALVLVILYFLLGKLKMVKGMRWLDAVAILLALLSIGAYFDFGRYDKIGLYINRHDFFHYYMGSKYSDELGYHYLYEASIVADHEVGKTLFREKTIRKQADYSYTPVEQVIAEKERYIGMFTTDRWNLFKKDIVHFQNLMGSRRWQRVLRDKGYNATPAWNAVARTLTNTIGTHNALGMRLLTSLDLGLMLLAFGLLWKAFGLRTMLFAIIFFGNNFMMHQTHIKGSLLRMDWLFCLMAGTAFLKMGKYKLSGGVMAYAAAARVFPAIFVFGIGIKAAKELVINRKLHRRYLEFFAVFGIVAALILGVTVVQDRGLDRWKEFGEIITFHNDDVVAVRAGFKYVFLNTYRNTAGSLNAYKDIKNAEFKERRVQWALLMLLALVVSGFAVIWVDDYETIPLSFVPVFFLSAPTFYYYVMMVVPLLFFAPKLDRIDRVVGLCFMFAANMVGFLMHLEHGRIYFTIPFVMSWVYLFLCFYLWGVPLYAGWKTARLGLKRSPQQGEATSKAAT